jgi:hypothetical protein
MRGKQQPGLDKRQEMEPWLEKLAWLMDRSIPVGRWSIGLDGLFGLIPGFGDLTGGILSTLIVVRSLQAGLPRPAILRMIINVATDSLLGTLPLIGDVFDFAFKANSKNLEIYRQYLREEHRVARDWAFIIAVTIFTMTLVATPILILLYLVLR